MLLKLITTVKDLQGSNYYEFLPRKFENKHWNPDSVFIYYEDIQLIDMLLKKHIPDYHPWSFMETDGHQAKALAQALNQYAFEIEEVDLKGFMTLAINYEIPPRDADEIEDSWETYRPEFAKMVKELAIWLERSVPEKGILSVLGL